MILGHIFEHFVVGDVIKLSWRLIIVLLGLMHLAQLLKYEENQILCFFKKIMEYGKLDEGKKRNRILRLFYLPKRHFTHFYLFACIWNLILISDFVLSSHVGFSNDGLVIKRIVGERESSVTMCSLIIVILMMLTQATRRLYECLFISHFSSDATINLAHYILGMYFYFVEPVSVFVGIGAMENIEFGSLEFHHFIGLVMFSWSSFYQSDSLIILSNLRKSPHDGTYRIPHGGLFKYVTSPHYFTEILIYLSMLLALGVRHIAFWHVFVFVLIIHFNMATMTHKWYISKFPAYPKDRKALVPMLY